MRFRSITLAIGVAVSACAVTVLAASGTAANANANYRAVCPGAPSGTARCHADVVTDAHGNVATPTTFVVHVGDTTAPTIAAHADVSA